MVGLDPVFLFFCLFFVFNYYAFKIQYLEIKVSVLAIDLLLSLVCISVTVVI